jgi:hypothetical protein
MQLSFSKWLNETLALKGNYKGNLFQRLVAAQYILAPTFDEDAEAAFQDLKNKITRQGEFLSSKFQMQPSQNDPYPSTKAMTRDIAAQRNAGIKKPVIPVYAEPPAMGGQEKAGHPIFSNDDNVTQRGVHDIMAHYYGQHPFSARGEYAAYNRHLKTLCNPVQVKAGECLAAKAMFTEVVAQTSYYYVYGTYADQKAVILYDFDFANVGRLASTSPLNKYFFVENKDLQKRPSFNWQQFYSDFPQLARELRRQETINHDLLPIAR